MMDWETSLGGDRRNFPQTSWAAILECRTSEEDKRKAAIETLTEIYWKPVYVYIRARWGKLNEDAKDLTQEFFAWIMESRFFDRADPARGRFRGFLKVALEHFMCSDERKRRSQKRGGTTVIYRCGKKVDEGVETELRDPKGRDPGEIMDDIWKRELLAHAVERLNQALHSEGKETYSRVFEDYYLGRDGGMRYRDVANKYGITEGDVSNYLIHAKGRFRVILRDLIAQTVEGSKDFYEEWVELFGSDRP